jgi:hypothetical protein
VEVGERGEVKDGREDEFGTVDETRASRSAERWRQGCPRRGGTAPSQSSCRTKLTETVRVT